MVSTHMYHTQTKDTNKEIKKKTMRYDCNNFNSMSNWVTNENNETGEKNKFEKTGKKQGK